ncbi:MAG: DUF1176 domain-containing protein [Sphingomonas sp.]
MNMRIAGTACLLVIAATALSATSSAPPSTVQSYDTYRSWFVACDNTLACVAKGFSDAGGGSELRIERAAGPKGIISASISAERPFALADVRIDGKPAGLAARAWGLTVAEGETSVATDDLGVIRAFVQTLRNGTKLTFGGDEEIPLDGFAAAMLRMDERQGRLGGVTAVLRTGSLPASRVPAPPPLPRIPNHPIASRLAPGEDQHLIAAVRKSQTSVFDKEECGETPAKPEAHALDGGQALVLIPCIMGAYQGSSLAFIASRAGGTARRLVAPTPYLGNETDHAEAVYLTDSVFDPETGTLSMAAKGRGMADCGTSASWIWTGAAFRLSEMTLQKSCGGVEPGDWPTLFRSVR